MGVRLNLASLFEGVRQRVRKHGLLFWLLIVGLAIIAIRTIRQENTITEAQAIIMLGLIGSLTYVWHHDEVNFREQRRQTFAEVLAAAEIYAHCFHKDDGHDKEPMQTRKALVDLQRAYMKMHLLISTERTHDTFNKLIAALNQLGLERKPWRQLDPICHNALQDFVRAARSEMGMTPGETHHRVVPQDNPSAPRLRPKRPWRPDQS